MMHCVKGLGSAAVALVAVLGVTSAAPVSASERAAVAHTVDVTQVSVGPHARIDYLTGRLLHTRSGRVIQLPFSRQFQDSWELLGRNHDGWVVVYHHTATIYQVAHDGSAHRLFQYWGDQGWEGYADVTLSTNGRMIAVRAADPGDSAYYAVYDLAGHELGSHSWSSGYQVAFRGRSIYLPTEVGLTRTKLVRWTVGSAPVDTGLRNVDVLDLAQDQFLQDVGNRFVRLAPVSQPGAIRWTVCTSCRGQFLIPRMFSPDGTELLFFHGSDTANYQGVTVRATSDGHVVTDLRFNAQVWRERWEDSRHVLVEVIRRQAGQSLYQAQKAVLRCGLGGRCTRVTVWQHHFILDYEPPGGL